MAHAVHEVLVERRAEALGCTVCCRCGGAASRVADRGLAVHDDADEALGVVDAGGDVRRVERLAIEATELDALVRRDDDALARRDLVGGERVLGAHGALGFDLDGHAHLVRHLLEVLGSHVGVGDTRGARGDGEDLRHAAILCRRRYRSRLRRSLGGLLGIIGLLGCVDRSEELVHGLRGTKRRRELLVHEQRRELREHLEVHVCLGSGRRDEEDQIGRLAIGRLPIHAAGHGDRHEARLLHGIGLGMRNRHALAYRRGKLSLARQHGIAIPRAVGNRSNAHLQIDERIDRFRLRHGRNAEPHPFRLEQSGYFHSKLLSPADAG